MRKLRLELDALRVETFETAAAGKGAGTVHAHARPTRQSCADTCDAACETFVSCFGSCEPCATNPTTCPTGVPFCCIA